MTRQVLTGAFEASVEVSGDGALEASLHLAVGLAFRGAVVIAVAVNLVTNLGQS